MWPNGDLFDLDVGPFFTGKSHGAAARFRLFDNVPFLVALIRGIMNCVY